MLAGLTVALALLAQAAGANPAAYGPQPPPAAKPKPKPPAAKTDGCRTAAPSADATEIIVCAERPQGYRIDPDVRAAKRHSRSGRPSRSTAHMKDTACASVGPAGCIGTGAGINLLGAALTAAEMASKLARGESIASMFVTTPEPTEYDLYVAAKRQREAEEAAAAAKLQAAATAGAKGTAATP